MMNTKIRDCLLNREAYCRPNADYDYFNTYGCPLLAHTDIASCTAHARFRG
jgi:hypothetical protein